MRTTNGNRDYIQLDGLRLDGYGWNYKRAVGASVPAVRSASSTAPGRPGRLYVPGTDVHDPAEVTIDVQVFPANPVTGIIESSFGARRAQLEDNLQTLLAVLGRPGRSLTYRYVDADGTSWTAQAVVAIPAQVDIRENNFIADITFMLEIPDVYLRSGEVSGNVPAGTDVTIPFLSGGTAPIYDATFIMSGTLSQPRLKAGWQGVGLDNGAMGWVLDTGQMRSTNMSGQSQMYQTFWTGTNMLVLEPTIDANGVATYLLSSTHPVSVTARRARYA